jgi:tetratricopeptide (TPR) repeat protein
MGAVWRAHDPELNRELAIKVLLVQWRADLERRFLEEAQVTGQLQHPGIPPIHEIGRLEDGRRFFAMKLIEGRTLDALLKERKSPEEELPRLLAIFGQICQTLGFVHSRGVIHRDLKPSNIMVGAFGEVQVMDWGLAKKCGAQSVERGAHEDGSALPAPRSPLDATQAGSVMGTPAFMAPEQARGEIDQLDERCDVFGLGAILCVILTGAPPFRGSNTQSFLEQSAERNLTDAFARLDRCTADRELVELARHCLDARREGRPRHGGEVAASVEAYQAGVQERLRRAELERASAEIRSAEERKRRRLAIGLAGAIIGLLLLGGLSLWRTEHQKTERREEQARLEAEQREAQARQEERTGLQIKVALDQAAALQKRALFTQAAKVLQEAAKFLDDDRSSAWRQRLAAAKEELTLVASLDRIRQDKALGVGRLLNFKGAPGRYRQVLKDAGFDVLSDHRADLVTRLRQSPIQENILAAMEDWASYEENGETVARLWKLTADVTGEKWREQLADLKVRFDRASLDKLLTPTLQNQMSATTLATLGELLHFQGGNGLAILIQAQRRLPSDFWVNFTLGNLSRSVPQYKAEVIGYYRAALATRPDNPAVYTNLGTFLFTEKKDIEGAIIAYRRAISLDSNLALAHHNLGFALIEANDLEGGMKELKKALELDETDVEFHNGLAGAMMEKYDLEGALYHCNRAVALDEKQVKSWNNLGTVQLARGEPAAAAEAYRRALKINEKFLPSRAGLGRALLGLGQFSEGRKELERFQKEASPKHRMRELVSRELLQAEAYIESEPLVPDVLAGKPLAARPEIQLTVAELCLRYRNHPAAALRLYTTVFNSDSRWLDHVPRGHRREAARAALLVACGIGEDAKGIEEQERIRLRKQALSWMQADVLALEKALREKRPLYQMREILSGLKRSPSFSCVRDPVQLGKLPDTERMAWRKVWNDIDAVFQQSFK